MVQGSRNKGQELAACCLTLFVLFAVCFLLSAENVFAGDLKLQPLIDEALKNNHEILMAEAKWRTLRFRIPQAKSLPDPMIMFGYQNEGWSGYTYRKMEGAQWMFSATQMFPYSGKLALKGEMASRDAEAVRASYEGIRLKTIVRVKELYHDLFLAYKEIDLIHDRSVLFKRIEDAAIARYSAGMGMQQEVLMAQAEQYMLLEREEMLKQKIQSIEAMLDSAIGRDVNSALGIPPEPPVTIFDATTEELQRKAFEQSPEIRSGNEMIAAADAKIKMAKREFYPDFSLTAGYFKRGGQFEDMWSVSTSFNIPLFYKTKQQQAVFEAESALSEAQHGLESMKIMISAAIRDNYSMLKTSGKLMELYREGLIPKTYQDFEAALAGYMSGKTEAITVINRLKSLIDYELLYWRQFSEREKAVARLDAITGGSRISLEQDSFEDLNPSVKPVYCCEQWPEVKAQNMGETEQESGDAK